METIWFDRMKELRKGKNLLEEKLNVKITIVGGKVILKGPAIDEYEAVLVLEAISFGYPVHTALLLKGEDLIFKRLSIKDFTRKKNLSVIKGRLIGTEGKTKKTIESIAGCKVIVKGNEVGIIGAADEIEYAITAITNLIRGSKQSNVYKFLERINTQKNK